MSPGTSPLRRLATSCAALLALAALAPAARGQEVIAPLQDGVILGGVVPLEVDDAPAPPTVRLDGQAVAPAWVASPAGRRRWVAELPVGAPGAHTLELSLPGRRPLTRTFRSGLGSTEAGDLVAERLLTRDPTRLAWLWGPAVLLYGAQQYAPTSPLRPRLVAFARAYQEHHARRGLPRIDHPDRAAPALAALSLWRLEGDPSGLPNAAHVADWLRREPRNALGALDHLGADGWLQRLASWSRFLGLFTRHWAHSMWLDSLYMYALFAGQWGADQGEPALQELGLSQPGIFARVLQDPRSGLMPHAWDHQHQRPLGEVWLRGNGWVAAALVDLLEVTPPAHPRRAELLAVLRALLDGLVPLQDPAGLWPTLLEEPSTYQESSGSALVAYALAKAARLGWVDPALRERARRTFRSLTARLRPRPVGASVSGTSIETSAWPWAWAYRVTPRRDDVDWGVGAYLLLAGELAGESW